MPVRQFRPIVRKPRRARRPGRKARIPRPVGGTNDYGQMARIKETVAYVDVVPNTGYNFNFNLSQYRRAMQLAPNFKWYKPTKVEWSIEPLYNTFQDGNAGTEITVPYLYVTMNRTQDTSGLSLEDIQAMGAKPQKLVSKKVIKYTPNWCVPGLTTYATQAVMASPSGTANALIRQTHTGMKATYDWVASPVQLPADAQDPNVPSYIVPALPFGTGQDGMNAVNASQVIYNGHTIWIEQLGSTQRCARVTATVHWSFKDPHCTYLEEGYTQITPA